jgi:hypothetical protein
MTFTYWVCKSFHSIPCLLFSTVLEIFLAFLRISWDEDGQEIWTVTTRMRIRSSQRKDDLESMFCRIL